MRRLLLSQRHYTILFMHTGRMALLPFSKLSTTDMEATNQAQLVLPSSPSLWCSKRGKLHLVEVTKPIKMRLLLKTVAYLLDPHNHIAHSTLLTHHHLQAHAQAQGHAHEHSGDEGQTLRQSDSSNSLASLDSSTSSNAAVKPYDNRFYPVGSSLSANDDVTSPSGAISPVDDDTALASSTTSGNTQRHIPLRIGNTTTTLPVMDDANSPAGYSPISTASTLPVRLRPSAIVDSPDQVYGSIVVPDKAASTSTVASTASPSSSGEMADSSPTSSISTATTTSGSNSTPSTASSSPSSSSWRSAASASRTPPLPQSPVHSVRSSRTSVTESPKMGKRSSRSTTGNRSNSNMTIKRVSSSMPQVILVAEDNLVNSKMLLMVCLYSALALIITLDCPASTTPA